MVVADFGVTRVQASSSLGARCRVRWAMSSSLGRTCPQPTTPMMLTLEFTLPRQTARTRPLFVAMARALLDAPVEPREVHREALDDPNGLGACFREEWSCEGVRYLEEVVAGEGNPRDGYGYHSEARLVLERGGGESVLRATDSSYGPGLSRLLVSCAGVDLEDLQVLRATLRLELGEGADRTSEPSTALGNARQLVEAGDMGGAVSLVREALAASSAQKRGHAQLLSWLAKADPDAVELRKRLRESPADVDAWREALLSPPKGYSVGRIARSLALLCPFDATRVRGPWLAHPSWPLPTPEGLEVPEAVWYTVHVPSTYLSGGFERGLCKVLSGLELDVDAFEVFGGLVEGKEGLNCAVNRAVRRTRRGLRSWVTLSARVVSDDPPMRAVGWMTRREVVWKWICGPAEGDLLLVARASWPVPHEAYAITWCAMGSDDFRQAVDSAVANATPYRVHPVSIEESLVPQQLPRLSWWDETLRTVKLAEAALRAVDLPSARLSRALELLRCRCKPRGYCEHRVALLQMSREGRFGAPREHVRSCALEVALEAVGHKPKRNRVIYLARQVHDQLAALSEERP